jgi:hypothetical protein
MSPKLHHTALPSTGSDKQITQWWQVGEVSKIGSVIVQGYRSPPLSMESCRVGSASMNLALAKRSIEDPQFFAAVQSNSWAFFVDGCTGCACIILLVELMNLYTQQIHDTKIMPQFKRFTAPASSLMPAWTTCAPSRAPDKFMNRPKEPGRPTIGTRRSLF